MKAMILAAGLGTRLKPLTFAQPKPMVPVLDRPVMAHLLWLLERHGFEGAVANLHYFPDAIRDFFGDGSRYGIKLEYRFEDELMGTAGGVRNVRDYLGADPFVIVSGDALTDVDLTALMERHRASGGIATLTVKQVEDTSQYGVVLHDAAGRITGFQEKPDPAEALSTLGNCGIYVFDPAIFDYFPERPFADWAQDVFPELLAHDAPFHIYETDRYWNDIGSLAELRQGTFDAMTGAVELDCETVAGEGREGARVGSGSSLADAALVDGEVWIGSDCAIGDGVSLIGPVVIGDGATIGAGAALRDTIVLPGGEVPSGGIAIGAIIGRA